MKYDIIKTDNYLIIIGDDSEIKEGDLCIANGTTYNNTIVKYMKSPCPPPYVSNLSILKKIIAHLPLNNSPILDGVDLLPPLEDDVWKIAIDEVGVNGEIYNQYDCETFIKGYNKAKEKYKWTDEDVIKIVEKSRETGLTAEYLLLLLFQPKYPVAFEQGNEVDNKTYTSVTRRYDGLTLWIGKYIY